MDYELALRLPNEITAPVLPLRLAYRHGTFLVLDHKGGLAQFAEDWYAANDLAGVTGRIIHWYTGKGVEKTGIYGFETILLSGRSDTDKTVWLTFGELGENSINVTPALDENGRDHAMPLSGAEFVHGRCYNELKAIQGLLVKSHPTEIEEDIKAHAPWLNAGGGMKVGSRLSLYGEEVREAAVVFDYLDQSQMAVTALSIYIPPVTFSPEDGQRRLWGQFGHA